VKVAKFSIQAVYIDCPYCEGGYTSVQSGSYLITEEDMPYIKLGASVICDSCGKEYKLPKTDIFKREVREVK